MAEVLAFVAAGLVAVWGVSHAIPTRQVVAGLEPTTQDYRLIFLQEWLAEAITMWGIAALIIAATIVGDEDSGVTEATYYAAAALLVALAALTALTGARTAVIWFKICPALLGSSAVLLVMAGLL